MENKIGPRCATSFLITIDGIPNRDYQFTKNHIVYESTQPEVPCFFVCAMFNQAKQEMM